MGKRKSDAVYMCSKLQMCLGNLICNLGYLPQICDTQARANLFLKVGNFQSVLKIENIFESELLSISKIFLKNCKNLRSNKIF